ncbi:MAG: hypothetical protein AAGA45_02595 [Verrucomicrobiota bacterium]
MSPRDAFAFHLPDQQQEWYSPKEVAAIIGRSDQYVRDAFDNQRILGYAGNGRARQAKRRNYLIHREGLLLFLLETANYRPEDFIRRMAVLLNNRTREELEDLRKETERLLAKSF